jgi:hypothetical protein
VYIDCRDRALVLKSMEEANDLIGGPRVFSYGGKPGGVTQCEQGILLAKSYKDVIFKESADSFYARMLSDILGYCNVGLRNFK